MTLSRSCNVFLVGDITFLKTNKCRHSEENATSLPDLFHLHTYCKLYNSVRSG